MLDRIVMFVVLNNNETVQKMPITKVNGYKFLSETSVCRAVSMNEIKRVLLVAYRQRFSKQKKKKNYMPVAINPSV